MWSIGHKTFKEGQKSIQIVATKTQGLWLYKLLYVWHFSQRTSNELSTLKLINHAISLISQSCTSTNFQQYQDNYWSWKMIFLLRKNHSLSSLQAMLGRECENFTPRKKTKYDPDGSTHFRGNRKYSDKTVAVASLAVALQRSTNWYNEEPTEYTTSTK